MVNRIFLYRWDVFQEMPNAIWKGIFAAADTQQESIKHPDTVKEVSVSNGRSGRLVGTTRKQALSGAPLCFGLFLRSTLLCFLARFVVIFAPVYIHILRALARVRSSPLLVCSVSLLDCSFRAPAGLCDEFVLFPSSCRSFLAVMSRFRPHHALFSKDSSARKYK